MESLSRSMSDLNMDEVLSTTYYRKNRVKIVRQKSLLDWSWFGPEIARILCIRIC